MRAAARSFSYSSASNTTKAEANRLFAQARYSEAISTYDRALGSCPNYLEYEIAVLKSNISACHLKLEEWKQAVDAANTALEALDKIDPPPSPPSKKEKEKTKEGDGQASHLDSDDVVVELAGGGGDDDDDDSAALAKLVADDRLKMLSFTGSAAVGWQLKAKSGKKRVVLELGGNAGCIVAEDGDVAEAAARCAVGGFSYAGQSCISVQRIFVQQEVFQQFLDALLVESNRTSADYRSG